LMRGSLILSLFWAQSRHYYSANDAFPNSW
jgi:hypothetical protein